MQKGSLLGNRYLLQDRLGIGGMSEVWIADDQKLGRSVALKILHDSLLENTDLRERFLREAELTARLSHPNIVPVFDSGLSEQGRPYIAMEYVSGQTLSEWMQREHSLAEIQEIFDQILRGVGEAHRSGIVHRDLKPDNIIIEEDGRVRILDFGVALDIETLGDNTEAGTIIGTARYLSPEQAHGEAADGRSDIYSVGIMLYEALAGKTPWGDGSAISSLVQQSMEPALPPSKINKTVPDRFDNITLRAIAYRPELRFTDAEDFREALWKEGDTSRSKAPWLWALVPVLLFAAGWWYIDGQRTVPDLKGATLLEAREQLFEEDLRWFSRQSASPRPPGTIILTSPAAGTSARAGDTVVLFVSTGPPRSAVPQLRGLREEEAVALLEEAGLEASVSEKSSPLTPGTVLRSDPDTGTLLREGETVLIEIAIQRQTPNCLGLQESACRDIAKGWKISTRPQVSSEEEGLVLRQRTLSSDELLLYISDGPEDIFIPDLRGLTIEEARSVLSSSSLGVRVQYREVWDETQANIVLQQTPRPDTPSIGGEEVLLVVGRFNQ